jgi:MacB-like periplasmic core domain/FtsX-like permease family
MHTLDMPTGYETKQVIDLEVQFPGGGGYDAARRAALTRTLRERIVSLPGVTELTVGRAPDGGGIRTAAISLNGEKPAVVKPERVAFVTYVQPNYFRTVGIPMISGNTFPMQQGEPTRDVVVSESQAKELWPGLNPIGRTITMDATDQYYSQGDPIPRGETYQVVGMVRDIRGAQLDNSDSRMIYMPLPEGQLTEHPMLIRFQGTAAMVTASIGQLASSVDPNMMLYAFVLEDLLRSTPPFGVSRLAAIFTTIIGLLGLFLASMGIYGTVSYVVLQRTREVGIRMALGAKKGDVLRLMLRESTRPVVAGLLAGVVLAAGASYLLRGILYGMSAVDGVSFLGTSVLFLAIALFAAYVPSRHAMRVDPVVALRYE